ncbi:S1 family peptidase [Streptomyces sp. J2-1]|uniref:S1 family peptidase n=1 Tax=Streptomyces corallincola TaxID=2851888 RepID=UPI001C387277|nr:S1 family peptidase [Streptomyces corallincola]MBV2357166.1 S1 family peptidase [Streptomyces corallincola]
MRHARRRIVRRVTRVVAVGGLLVGCGMVAQAALADTAPPASGTLSTASPAPDTGTALTARLGTARTAGSWIGADGRPVVAVTDEDTARAVRSAGAEAKVVPHSMDELKSAVSGLRSAPRVAGTAWALDYRTNRVVVRADSTVSAAGWAKMSQLATKLGDFVRMERAAGRFTTRLNGARPILSSGGRCSAGFNVTDGRSDFILTAGHCGPTGSVWFGEDQSGPPLGRTVGSTFPNADFSLVRYDTGRAGPGADVVAVGDGKGVRITGAADPVVGQRVFRSGSTSGLHDGAVTALNATVNYPEGSVSGLVETDVCAEPGDSGGPLFADGVALGVTSGGSGDCATGGTTFFQPVTRALTALNVRLITSAGVSGSAARKAPAAGATGGAVARGAAKPGVSASPAGGTPARSLVARITDPRNVGPGLLVVAGSAIALAATRYIRSEQDRRAYRRHYSANWG